MAARFIGSPLSLHHRPPSCIPFGSYFQPARPRRRGRCEAKKFLDAYYCTDYDRERLKGWVAYGPPEEAVGLYSVLFDAKPFRRDEVADLAAARASFDVRGFTIDLLWPTGNGPVREALASDGEGPFEVRITVEDLTAARRAMQNVKSPGHGELRPQTDATLGARLVFAEGSPGKHS